MKKQLLWMLCCGLLLTGKVVGRSPETDLAQLIDRFVTDYRALASPYMGLDYRDYFRQIPSADQLDRQEAVFRKYEAALGRILPETLSENARLDYHHLRYQLGLNRERIRLEKQFLRDYPDKKAPEGGLSRLPNGRDWYRYFVRKYTSTDATPEELLVFGKREVANALAQINRIRRETGYARDSAGFFRHLNSPAFILTDEAQVQADYGRIRQTVSANLHRLFAVTDVPTLAFAPIPGAGPQTPPGYYNPPGPQSGPGTFYYNFYENRHNSRGMDFLFIHEGVPGHHYDFTLRRPGESPLQRLFAMHYNGYFEGWAAYCESLGKDLGLYQTPYQELGRWEWDLVRSARVVIDVGIHYLGWTQDEALAYWHRTIPNQDEIADREVIRCTNWAGQVLSYKVGAAKISEWKQRRRAEQGAAFSEKDFHTSVLRHGRLPLLVLDRS